LAGVRSELVAAREAHDVAAAQLSSVTARGGLSSAGLKAIADEAIASDTGLSALKTTINERRAVLNTQMATLTPSNPVYKQDADEIASMDKQVDARSTQLRQTAEHRVEDKLRLELQRTGDVESRLNGELAHATAQAGSAAPKLQRAKDLAADITRLQARYATVDDALRGLQLESSGPGTAHLLVAAQVPDAPAANHRILLLALALPLAAFAGILAAVLARKSDKRLHSAMDLEQAVGVMPMCALPGSYEHSHDEHLLRLATGLERGHRLNGARMFVFTAASESIDTAGVIYGVQSKLSELGFKVVVLAAEDVRQTTAAGRRLGKSSSQIEELKRENAFLLIDARPLLHSADAEYAVSCADATLVIAESGFTTGVELKRCMLLLQQLKATGVGTILLNASGAAGEAPARRSLVPEEPRQRVPMWERSRSAVSEDLSFVPKWRDDDEAIFKTQYAETKEELPKRVQLVPTAAEAVKPVSMAYREEPFMLFEEAAFVAPAPKPNVPEEIMQAEMPVVEQPVVVQEIAKEVEVQVVSRVVTQQVAVEQKAEAVTSESTVIKTDQMKRAAIERVRARFGMPLEAVEALSAAMQKPVQRTEPAFAPMVAFRPASPTIPTAMERSIEKIAVAPAPQVPVEEKRFEQRTALEQVLRPVVDTMQQPVPAANAPVSKPQPTVAATDLPPVRRVMVQQERPQPATAPVVQWALQPERRRVPREPIAFPRGLNKAALRMQEKGQAIAKGHAGPSLTAAEQAIANKISSTNQPVAAKPEANRRVDVEQAAEQGGRWSLLRQFGGFEVEEQNGPSLQDRAAG